jgi:hypothetical protein
MAPDTLSSVHLAEGVMQHDVGCARHERARVIANHRVKTEQRFDQIAFEPTVEKVRSRLSEEVEEHPPLFHGQPAQPISGHDRLAELPPAPRPQTFDHIGRRLQHQASQHVGDSIYRPIERVIALGIAHAELGDFLARPPFGSDQVLAVKPR